MKHAMGNDRSFRVHAHEFVITQDDIGMLMPQPFNARGYVTRCKLSESVVQWLEERKIKYFVRSSFFDLNLLFDGDEHAAMFKLTWGL
jgi:hypothetical protein